MRRARRQPPKAGSEGIAASDLLAQAAELAQRLLALERQARTSSAAWHAGYAAGRRAADPRRWKP